MGQVRFEAISKSYGAKTVLAGIGLTIEPSGLTVFCGPPGAGKSVLMRILVGLEPPSAGRVLVDGQDITRIPAAARKIGYVPQSFALFPHMSVFDNVAYPMALQRVPRGEIASRVAAVADMLKIGPLLHKRPSQLSGGEKQRAAIARGILKNADIFILDDPLVGLDFKLREGLMSDLKSMQAQLGATFLYVTSDSLEALTMAQELVVMEAGRLLQAGPVETVYAQPMHLRAAELIGFPRCNVLPGTIANGVCTTPAFAFACAGPPRTVDVAVRPEHLRLTSGGDGEISLLEDLGAELVIYVRAGPHSLVTILPAAAAPALVPGQRVGLAVQPGAPMVFETATGARAMCAEMRDA